MRANIGRKLREIQSGMSYDDRYRLSIELIVLGDLSMDRFYHRDRAVINKLVRAGIIKEVSRRERLDKGWYAPATPEVGNLLVRGSVDKENGYLILPFPKDESEE